MSTDRWNLHRLSDPEAVRRFMDYHKGRDEAAWRAGFARLCELGAAGRDDPQDPLVKEFWRATTALEETRSAHHGRRVLAARTRRKVAKDGAQATIASLAARPEPSDGFRYLVSAGLAALTAEAIVLRHPTRFEVAIRDAARRKLQEAAVDLDSAQRLP